MLTRTDFVRTKDIDGVKRNIETYESAKDLAGTVKKVLGSQGDLANINTQKSRQNYRKELAKTIGAWGGIGAAGVAGTTAIANAAKPKRKVDKVALHSSQDIITMTM